MIKAMWESIREIITIAAGIVRDVIVSIFSPLVYVAHITPSQNSAYLEMVSHTYDQLDERNRGNQITGDTQVWEPVGANILSGDALSLITNMTYGYGVRTEILPLSSFFLNDSLDNVTGVPAKLAQEAQAMQTCRYCGRTVDRCGCGHC